jgi:hypothetical protein
VDNLLVKPPPADPELIMKPLGGGTEPTPSV